jgi:hypothetical protein
MMAAKKSDCHVASFETGASLAKMRTWMDFGEREDGFLAPSCRGLPLVADLPMRVKISSIAAKSAPRITNLSQLMRIALTSQNRFDDCLSGHSAHIA